MADLYLFDPGGDPDDRDRRLRERDERRAAVRARYAALVARETGVDEVTTDLVMAVLFDHVDAQGERCQRNTHPQLPDDGEHSYDAGFDCPCTWDADRVEAERRARAKAWEDWVTSPESDAIRRHDEAEAAAVATWLDGEPRVSAERTVSACPEVWEGSIDGHSFYFRERHGDWRIELDLAPDGHFANRVVGTGEDGELVTERVELESGEVIAEGVAAQLGETSVDHLASIVRTVREYLRRSTCSHVGAGPFCPLCGARI